MHTYIHVYMYIYIAADLFHFHAHQARDFAPLLVVQLAQHAVIMLQTLLN